MIYEYLKEVIKKSKDTLIKEIIKMYYLNNFKDKEIISKLPISETLYYKNKRLIEDNIYHLLIYKGYVSEEELKKEVINDGYNN